MSKIAKHSFYSTVLKRTVKRGDVLTGDALKGAPGAYVAEAPKKKKGLDAEDAKIVD